MSKTTLSPPNPARTNEVIKRFREDGNAWRTSGQIQSYLGEGTSVSTRYLFVSACAAYGVFERMSSKIAGSDYVYRLSPQYADPSAVYVKPAKGAVLPAAEDDLITLPNVKIKKARKPVKNYVNWDKHERKLIEDECRLIRATNPQPLTVAIMMAQRALVDRGLLPQSRTRRINQLKQIMWLHQALQTKGTPKPQQPAVQATSKPAITTLTNGTTEEARANANATASVSAPLKTSVLIEILLTRTQQAATKILSDAIDYGLTRAFKNIVGSEQGKKLLAPAMRAIATSAPKHNPEPPSPDRRKLPSILIAGIRPSEMHDLILEFRDVLDLRYWKEGEGTAQLTAMARAADTTLVLTMRVGHSDSDIVKANSKNPVFLSGPPSAGLHDKLLELYAMT